MSEPADSEPNDIVAADPEDVPLDDVSTDMEALAEPMPVAMPIEAEPADVLEQKQPVPQDDEEYRES